MITREDARKKAEENRKRITLKTEMETVEKAIEEACEHGECSCIIHADISTDTITWVKSHGYKVIFSECSEEDGILVLW